MREEEEEDEEGAVLLLPATGLRSTQISSLLPPWGPPAGVGEPCGLESEPREPLTQKPPLTAPWLGHLPGIRGFLDRSGKRKS